MYNSKFICEDGQELYPGYLSKEQREKIKEKYQEKREYMKCGCKPESNLYYRISEDLKIYPEHKNYQHDLFCCRYRDEEGKASRQTAYVIDEEDGAVTAYISFDPKTFNTNEVVEREQNNQVPEEMDDAIEEIIIEKDEETTKKAERKEPKLALAGLIRSINVDCFTEKILNNRKIESKEKFSTYVFYRMKKVNLSRTKKSIGELTLESDGVRFVYLPFVAAQKKTEKGITRCYLQTKGADGKVYNNFVFPEIMEKAIKEYKKAYGQEPDHNTMLGGFQYLKKAKNKNTYRVMGRVHLFQVSDIGLYCRTMQEVQTFNQLQELSNKNEDIRYWIPPEDESLGAIIEIQGKKKKILLMFRSSKSERVSYDTSLYVPYVVENGTVLSKEELYEVLEENEI